MVVTGVVVYVVILVVSDILLEGSVVELLVVVLVRELNGNVDMVVLLLLQ